MLTGQRVTANSSRTKMKQKQKLFFRFPLFFFFRLLFPHIYSGAKKPHHTHRHISPKAACLLFAFFHWKIAFNTHSIDFPLFFFVGNFSDFFIFNSLSLFLFLFLGTLFNLQTLLFRASLGISTAVGRGRHTVTLTHTRICVCVWIEKSSAMMTVCGGKFRLSLVAGELFLGKFSFLNVSPQSCLIGKGRKSLSSSWRKTFAQYSNHVRFFTSLYVVLWWIPVRTNVNKGHVGDTSHVWWQVRLSQERENALLFFFHSIRFFRPKQKNKEEASPNTNFAYSLILWRFSPSIFSLLSDQTCPVVPELCCRLSFEHHLSSKTARFFLSRHKEISLHRARKKKKKTTRKNNLTVFGLWSGLPRPSESFVCFPCPPRMFVVEGCGQLLRLVLEKGKRWNETSG